VTAPGDPSPFGPAPFAAAPAPSQTPRAAGRSLAIGTVVLVTVVLVAVLLGLLLTVFNLAATQNLQDAVGAGQGARGAGPDRFSAATSAPAGDFAPGDCVDVDTGGDATTVAADCDAPHDAEVFAVPALPAAASAAYPGADLRRVATGLCVLAFAPYTGEPYTNATDLEVSALYPTRDAWREGTRDVVCLVHAAAADGELDAPVRE
jgi:hypothetical protein